MTTPPEDRTTEGGEPRDGAEDDPGATERISEGIRQGIGALSASKEALEETVDEARERGDLSTDRAKALVRDAMTRAREAAGSAKERLDFAPRDEVERLRQQVDELRVRLQNLEQRASQAPDVGPSRPADDDETP